MPHALSWHVLPGQRLHYRQWEQEAVLFNDLSGDTHLLDADALALLLAVHGGARDAAAMRLALGLADEDQDANDALQALLEQLASISLIAQRA
ncbi:HPr-rel-A system PqqD family peptide chaperone [Massilia genomosp. 1]|uniref:HPr-rel-A system PqqD family peptide chaperone n=1 Tax=Massilia genomosp. 1 TaxID=2609280 RepID=A0ABX0MMB8_9BURK|nr:HPr-rel-A system PqqD family peptide chaperone [Massilia genomosp. 1]NHZ63506.1 HPr-rel-A system PqqD family peptide chaperone [Massilia genomosp. 1]